MTDFVMSLLNHFFQQQQQHKHRKELLNGNNNKCQVAYEYGKYFSVTAQLTAHRCSSERAICYSEHN
jgi:hypothetical protein